MNYAALSINNMFNMRGVVLIYYACVPTIYADEIKLTSTMIVGAWEFKIKFLSPW